MPTWFKVKKTQKFTHFISNNKTVKENGVVRKQNRVSFRKEWKDKLYLSAFQEDWKKAGRQV